MSAESLPPVAKAGPSSNGDAQLDRMARRVLEEIATAGTGPDVQLDEYIHVLSEYRRSCEQRENYREAELVQHVLKHLRLEEETRHVRGLTEQQDLERRGLEEAHLVEFSNFNRVWNERIDNFEERQIDAEAAMLERHSQELAAFHAEMTAAEGRRTKQSKDLLQVRVVQRTLASQRNYADAQKAKLKGDKMEQIESDKMLRERIEEYSRREALVLVRHRQELAALRQRMDRAKLELERARRKELEMLLQRYNNVRRGLEGQQNIVRSRTGNLLLKHANNKKSDTSGSQAIILSMASGAFGSTVQRRQLHAASADADPDAPDMYDADSHKLPQV
jgi:chemotaxis protein histidine kinase CheA